MQNTPYMTYKTMKEMVRMAENSELDKGRFYHVMDNSTRVMAISETSWVILYPTSNTFGPEMLLDPGFTTGTEWTLFNRATISGGRLNFASDANSSYARQAVAPTVGKTYSIRVYVDTVTGNGIECLGQIITTPGLHQFEVVWESGTTFQINGLMLSTGIIDFVSMREIISQEISVGPELVQDPDFDTGIGWVVDVIGSSTISGGKLTLLPGYNGSYIFQYGMEAVGTFERVKISVLSITGQLSVLLGYGTTDPKIITAPGSYIFDVQQSSDQRVMLAMQGNLDTCEIDFCSVKEIL
jgi:hypothetical protein